MYSGFVPALLACSSVARGRRHMPGLCFLQSFTGCLDIPRARQAASALGLPGWNSRTYVEAAGCLALGRDYDGYPILVWENEQYHFYLEGYLYGLTRRQATLTVESLAGTVFSNPPMTSRLSAWILKMILNHLMN